VRTDDYDDGTADDYDDGTADDYDDGTADDYDDGTADDYDDGTADDYHDGTADDYDDGTADDYHDGTADDYHDGTADDHNAAADLQFGVRHRGPRDPGVPAGRRPGESGHSGNPPVYGVLDWFYDLVGSSLRGCRPATSSGGPSER
jgi:hypothetical protein